MHIEIQAIEAWRLEPEAALPETQAARIQAAQGRWVWMAQIQHGPQVMVATSAQWDSQDAESRVNILRGFVETVGGKLTEREATTPEGATIPVGDT